MAKYTQAQLQSKTRPQLIALARAEKVPGIKGTESENDLRRAIMKHTGTGSSPADPKGAEKRPAGAPAVAAPKSANTISVPAQSKSAPSAAKPSAPVAQTKAPATAAKPAVVAKAAPATTAKPTPSAAPQAKAATPAPAAAKPAPAKNPATGKAAAPAAKSAPIEAAAPTVQEMKVGTWNAQATSSEGSAQKEGYNVYLLPANPTIEELTAAFRTVSNKLGAALYFIEKNLKDGSKPPSVSPMVVVQRAKSVQDVMGEKIVATPAPAPVAEVEAEETEEEQEEEEEAQETETETEEQEFDLTVAWVNEATRTIDELADMAVQVELYETIELAKAAKMKGLRPALIAYIEEQEAAAEAADAEEAAGAEGQEAEESEESEEAAEGEEEATETEEEQEAAGEVEGDGVYVEPDVEARKKLGIADPDNHDGVEWTVGFAVTICAPEDETFGAKLYPATIASVETDDEGNLTAVTVDYEADGQQWNSPVPWTHLYPRQKVVTAAKPKVTPKK